jgi:hypothetical protein
LDSIGHCRFRRGILACIVYLTSGTAMGTSSFNARYTAALAESRGRCPIETGVLGRLADRECRHGRLPYGRTPVRKLASGRRGDDHPASPAICRGLTAPSRIGIIGEREDDKSSSIRARIAEHVPTELRALKAL